MAPAANDLGRSRRHCFAPGAPESTTRPDLTASFFSPYTRSASIPLAAGDTRDTVETRRRKVICHKAAEALVARSRAQVLA